MVRERTNRQATVWLRPPPCSSTTAPRPVAAASSVTRAEVAVGDLDRDPVRGVDVVRDAAEQIGNRGAHCIGVRRRAEGDHARARFGELGGENAVLTSKRFECVHEPGRFALALRDEAVRRLLASRVVAQRGLELAE